MTKKRFVAIGVEWTDGFIQDHIGDRDLFNIGAVCNLLDELSDENEQLKQQVTHLTMYKNLFREFQKQLDGVKRKSDLDSKDFEDLIELTKGHVFDDEHGWIHLPVNDR